MDGWSLESAWAARRMQCGLQSGCRLMMRVVPEWPRGHTILRRMPPQRMGKHRDGRDGCAGDGPNWPGGRTARPRACLIGLFPSFFFGVSSRQPRFISVPSVSNPCWCGWVGFFSIFWIWREEGSSVVGFASFETGNHHPACWRSMAVEGLVLSSQCMGYRWLTPRHRVFPQACTCVPSVVGRQWEVRAKLATTKT